MTPEQFYKNLQAAASTHPAGAAVEVKDLSFYLNNKTALFYSEDGRAGAAVTEDGELVSVFKEYGSGADIDKVLTEACKVAKKLDCFASGAGEKLVQLYKTYGFKEVKRLPFNPDYAPANWPERLGKPDVVFMEK